MKKLNKTDELLEAVLSTFEGYSIYSGEKYLITVPTIKEAKMARRKFRKSRKEGERFKIVKSK